jgi:predicted  nucleic acid-binding Zn-ribbon protein
MLEVTKEQIDTLVNIQQIELEMSKIQTKLGKVNQRIEELDGKQIELKQTVEQQEATIKGMNRQYRTYESDAQTALDRIKKSEAKLSSVKTNKEYQSSLKEIDELKAKNSKLEDEMIEFLDRIESENQVLKSKIVAYSTLKAQVDAEKETIQKEAREESRQLEKLDAEWKTLSENIDAELLLTPVEKAVCQGCHVNIPPQLYNELQRGDRLQRCPICQRLIYWRDPKERSE